MYSQFFGDADSGERSSILYTIIECCRRRGINPFDKLSSDNCQLAVFSGEETLPFA